jgi:N-acetylmuramoyl-L-alanine amidase
MPNDGRYWNDDDSAESWRESWNSQPEENPEMSASVAFMEMMRQAAAKAQAQNPPVTVDEDIPPLPTALSSEAAEPQEKPDRKKRAADMEEQRVRRVQRRKARRRQRTTGVLGGMIRTLFVIIIAAGLTATIFTWWTPSQSLSREVRSELSVAYATSQMATLAPTSLPTPNWLRRIGIVSGHRGPENDPGAVCPDGLTEAEINFNVAQLVVRSLRGRGYTVDLLDEFDPRLDNYQAAALVSIHANTCQSWPGGEVVSGYLIAGPAARVSARGNDEVLVNCVALHYEQVSGLQRRAGVTVDMTDYHSFREIHSLTPAAIIELGFMLADRDVLTQRPDALARGITDGILCYLEPGKNPAQETPAAPTTLPVSS